MWGRNEFVYTNHYLGEDEDLGLDRLSPYRPYS